MFPFSLTFGVFWLLDRVELGHLIEIINRDATPLAKTSRTERVRGHRLRTEHR